jgi:hypothetical protein
MHPRRAYLTIAISNTLEEHRMQSMEEQEEQVDLGHATERAGDC